MTLCERQRLDRVCIVVPPVSPADVAERLGLFTGALAGAPGWGDISGDAISGQGEVVTRVGLGARRDGGAETRVRVDVRLTGRHGGHEGLRARGTGRAVRDAAAVTSRLSSAAVGGSRFARS